jgi:hypothetical protein
MSIHNKIVKNRYVDEVKDRTEGKIKKLKHKDKRRFSKIRNAIKRNSKK